MSTPPDSLLRLAQHLAHRDLSHWVSHGTAAEARGAMFVRARRHDGTLGP